MGVILEISTKDYETNLLLIKKALSQLETLVQGYDGYLLSDPTKNFGWTFFKIAFKPKLQQGIEDKFADMLRKYRWSKQPEKFTKFMSDYFKAKGCDVKVKLVDY